MCATVDSQCLEYLGYITLPSELIAFLCDHFPNVEDRNATSYREVNSHLTFKIYIENLLEEGSKI